MQRDIENIIFENTPKIQELAHICETNTAIDKELYTKYEVKRGLRDLNGKGVLAGLTNISDIVNTKVVDGKEVPCEGSLYYRGYNIKELIGGFLKDLKRQHISFCLENFRQRCSWMNFVP